MSTKYTGGFITKAPVAPTSSAASGIWTLDQQQQAQKAGTWPSPPIFIEDLFSTYLYTGTGSTQTITNGIDLAGQGGLVWQKNRTQSDQHILSNTVAGVGKFLFGNLNNAQQTEATAITQFNSTGFTFGGLSRINFSGDAFVSWTFREQPKFFDIVTFTTTASTNRRISHSLGSAPGFIIVKSTSNAGSWFCYHISTGISKYFTLNSTTAETTYTNIWGTSAPTSTDFGVDETALFGSGESVTAFLFAHNAGGFPVSGGGSTNGISCGSFTTDGSGVASVTLGYEPQWVLIKKTTAAQDWILCDTMRGWNMTTSTDAYIAANTSTAESLQNLGNPTATGFDINAGSNFGSSSTFIYIAIRRGPMKTPTVGTSVYENTAYTGNGASNRLIGSSVLTDLLLLSNRDATATDWSTYAQFFFDRLRSQNLSLATSNTNAETSGWNNYCNFDMNTGWDTGITVDQQYLNKTSSTYVSNALRRAPGFFDVVCYTGTGSARTVTHNLAAVPELMIVKRRNDVREWNVYASPLGATKFMFLNTQDAVQTDTMWNDTAPTSSVFTVGTYQGVNASASTYVAYLFATLAGVSKVGSYTGTGALLTVACGFTSGARFVMIKRTDSTGGWFFWDSARGITVSDDPYLLFNSSAAEVTGTNYVDTDTTGFKVTAAAPAALNASGGNFIFLAIA